MARAHKAKRSGSFPRTSKQGKAVGGAARSNSRERPRSRPRVAAKGAPHGAGSGATLSSSQAMPDLRSLVSQVGVGVAGTAISTLLLPRLTAVPMRWSVPLFLAPFFGWLLYSIPVMRRLVRAVRWGLTAYVVFFCVAGPAVALRLQTATHIDRLVHHFAMTVCSDPMWVDHSATCFSRSEKHIV